ncbi:MAG: TerC family protein [Candidatus Abyssobacteria bacterium SURF_5]|uniref:TerC family protein n=1 Tax=Abyssobacteria bacterium (strain SURF_5) TaxID=2093360 RepID=A0A3A4NJ08_ABYX5|nr:MAG: TerC family protein [Candidatus Abyssubacteria bacterium SURF_5]
MSNQLLAWVGFNLFVLAMLAVDLGFFHRKAHAVGIRESLLWTVLWIILALLFNVGIYFVKGPETALNFLTGYLLEKSLSVDNLFVFLLVFSYFSVPRVHQHRVLFWGILGALVMRAVFIATGVALMERFHWIIYVFGPFLVITGIRMAFEKEKEIHPERNPVLRLFRRFFGITEQYVGSRFFFRDAGRFVATPLLVVLLVIETTDIIFALDSIPAILAITTDPFIVYSSNVFAILGLRALYFALSGMMQLFHHLNYGLSAVLAFVGIKMMCSEYIEIPVVLALGVIAFILLGSVVASLIFPKREQLLPLPQVEPGADPLGD